VLPVHLFFTANVKCTDIVSACCVICYAVGTSSPSGPVKVDWRGVRYPAVGGWWL